MISNFSERVQIGIYYFTSAWRESTHRLTVTLVQPPENGIKISHFEKLGQRVCDSGAEKVVDQCVCVFGSCW